MVVGICHFVFNKENLQIFHRIKAFNYASTTFIEIGNRYCFENCRILFYNHIYVILLGHPCLHVDSWDMTVSNSYIHWQFYGRSVNCSENVSYDVLHSGTVALKKHLVWKCLVTGGMKTLTVILECSCKR